MPQKNFMCNKKTVLFIYLFIYYENVFSSCIVAIHFLGNNRLIWPFTLVATLQVSNDRFKKLFILFVLVSEYYTCDRGCKNLIITETTPFINPLLTSDPWDNKRKLNSVTSDTCCCSFFEWVLSFDWWSWSVYFIGVVFGSSLSTPLPICV